MKTDNGIFFNFKTIVQKVGITILFVSSFYGFDTLAQGDRGGNRNRGEGSTRQGTRREQPSVPTTDLKRLTGAIIIKMI